MYGGRVVTVETEMIVHYTHDGCPSPLPLFSREPVTSTDSFTSDALRQPANEEVKARMAHLDDIFLVPETLRMLVTLYVVWETDSSQPV